MSVSHNKDSSKTADIQRTSERRTVAVIAMVMGIIGVLTAWLFAAGLPFAIIAVVLASIALLQRRPGKPFAVAGLVLGVVGIIIGLGALVWMASQVYQAWHTTVKTEEVTVRQSGHHATEQQYFSSEITLGQTTLQQVEERLGSPTARQQGPLVSGTQRHPEIESREYQVGDMTYYVYYKDGIAVKKFTKQEAQAHHSVMRYP